MNRRSFFKCVAAGCAAWAVGAEALADGENPPRALWLARGRESGLLDIAAERDYQAACWLLRDTLRGREALASMRLLQTAAWMQAFLALYQVHRPFVVHSGFRTRYTNELAGGAKASLHMLDPQGYFHAMDIHMAGISPEYLGRLAALARQGGVGFYTDRDNGFVHIDDGRVRYWRG
jgi:hypothetical protein